MTTANSPNAKTEGWYVVHTHVRAEKQAEQHLRRQGFETFLPMFLRRRRHARRVDNVESPLFPRYLFLRMDPGATSWRAIQSTIGVSALVCHGDRPAKVPPGIVEEIQARRILDETMPALNRGDKVRIAIGPMLDQIGLFDRLSDDERVIVLLNLLGREIRVAVPAAAVEAIA